MSFVINFFILFMLIASFLAEKMNLFDWSVCNSCLNIISNLKKTKNSSLCEKRNLDNDLMCYEIYYYLYYFQSEIFFTEDDSIKNECNACSYLDKCLFFECVNQNKNYTIRKNNDQMKFMQFNDRSQINLKMTNRNKKNLNSKNKKNEEELENYIEDIKKFNNIRNITNNFDYRDNLISNHLSIIKSKTKDILNKLVNLAQVNIYSLNIKKNLINLFIFEKLKTDNKLNLTSTNNTRNKLVKIKNKNFEENYLSDIKKLVEEFMNLSNDFDVNIKHENQMDKILKISTQFLQSYNEMNILVDILSQENKKLIESILKDFTEQKFKDSSTLHIKNDNTKIFKTKSNIQDLSGLKLNIKSIGNLDNLNKIHSYDLESNQYNNYNQYEKLSLIIDKLSRIEKEQETFKRFLMGGNSTLYNLNQKNQTNSTILNVHVFKDTVPNNISKKDIYAFSTRNISTPFNLNNSNNMLKVFNYQIPNHNHNKIEIPKESTKNFDRVYSENRLSKKINEEPTINLSQEENEFKQNDNTYEYGFLSRKKKKNKKHYRRHKY
jgi:hypothetical protein